MYNKLGRPENFNLTDKVVIEKISNLQNNLTPLLRHSYDRLTTIYKIPIPNDIVATINGVNVIALIWWSHKSSPPIEFSSVAPKIPLWVPQKDLNIPPDQLEGINVYTAI